METKPIENEILKETEPIGDKILRKGTNWKRNKKNEINRKRNFKKWNRLETKLSETERMGNETRILFKTKN